MKSVKVSYTVKPSFVAQNQQNINAFMEELKQLGRLDIRYSIYLGEDGKTFTHLSLYQNVEAQNTFLELESFKFFQKERDESGLEMEPNIEVLNLLAAY
uniref:hypothetical protein n=1 Tax=Pedobacter schmidteae TaxID=2201271 RepID=UPI000EB0E630|nr:hypothetical protein [Pedobacter schmidteae]